MKPSPKEAAAFESFARAALGKPKTSKGKPVPAKKPAQAKQSTDPAERKRAQFAANVKRWGN